MSVYNSGVSIRNFLQTDEKPMDLEEFFEFWNALTPEEQEFYRTTKLS
jgi:murein L,D-transpeptidase YafK